MIFCAPSPPKSAKFAKKSRNTVPPQEKRRRSQAINSLLKKQALAINKKYLNREVEILIDKIEDQFAFGKTTTNKGVMISRKKHKIGQIATVKITNASAWSLKGIES